MVFRRWLVLFLLALPFRWSGAHCILPDSARSDTLRTAVVTARGRRPAEAEARIPRQLLTDRLLRASGAVDMGSALRRLAGISLRDYGGAGGLKTVSVRGLGAAHTNVTYDGLAVGDARQGQTDLSRFDLEGLGSIGLTVADASGLLVPVRNLGAATLDLTPSRALRDDTARLGGRLGYSMASFHTYAPFLQLGFRPDSTTTWTVRSHYQYGRNDYPYTWHNGSITTRERRNHSKMQRAGIETALHTRDRGQGEWSLLAAYDDDDRDLPGQVVLYTEKGTEQLRERRAFAQLMHRRAFPGNRLSLMAGAKFNFNESDYRDIDAQYPGGMLHQHYFQREWYATGGLKWHTGGFSLAYATDYFLQSLNSNLPSTGHASRHTWLQALSAAYAGRGYSFTARLCSYLDRNSNDGGVQAARDVSRLTPMLAANLRLVRWCGQDSRAGRQGRGSLHARILYKESFRTPTFTESYYYHLGPQTLRPELVRQAGAGLTMEAHPATSLHSWDILLTVDGYFNRIKDRISAIPYNLYVWRMVNVGRTHIGGIDVAGRTEMALRADHRLLLQANYSWQHAADRTDPHSQSYGKQPAYMPRHTVGASLDYDNPWIGVTLSMTAVSERWSTHEHTATTRLPAYHEWNVALHRTFPLPHGRSLDMRADVLNLLDHQYEVIRRYPMPGRSYRITVAMNF